MVKRGFKEKKGIVSEYLPWLLIALAILIILSLSAFIFKGKGLEIISKGLELFRGRT